MQKIIEKFTRAFHIPVSYYEKDSLLFRTRDLNISVDMAKISMEPYILSDYTSCIFASPRHLLYAYIYDTQERYYLIGPVCDESVSLNDFDMICRHLKLFGEKKQEAARYLRALPQFSQIDFCGITDFLCQIIRPGEEGTASLVQRSDPEPDIRADEFTILESAYDSQIERLITDIVDAGDVKKLQQIFQNAAIFSGGFEPILGTTSLRAAKNLFIACTAIISRRSSAAGFSHKEAMILSDQYIYNVEKLSGIDEVFQLLYQMIERYTQLVAASKMPEKATYLQRNVHRCIQDHIYEPIDSIKIAGYLNLNAEYLRKQFHKQTGISLIRYIKMQKINRAMLLLKDSSQSLSSISEKLAFSSQQRFQSVFKEITGDTPGHYREMASSV